MQKEEVLRDKIKIWNKFFNSEGAGVKNGEENSKGGQGASQKWTGNEAELKPNPTKKKQQKEGNLLRGPLSLEGKRADK